MLRAVPAPEGVVQILRQPLRFPGLGDSQIHARLAFPELFCRFCSVLRQAGHPEPVKLWHLLRGWDVGRVEAEQVEGGEVRQFSELCHSGEISQVSRCAPEPQLLQAGMNNGQAGQVKLFQPDTMQSPQVRQLRVGAVFPDKLEG